jgi:DNA mismatch repair protein PMS2
VQQCLSVSRPRNLELSAIDELIAVEHSDILRANGFDIAVNEDQPAGQRVKLTGHPVSKSTVFGMPGAALQNGRPSLMRRAELKENPGARMVRPAKVRSMLASRACRKSVMSAFLALSAGQAHSAVVGSSLKSGQMRNVRTIARKGAQLMRCRSCNIWAK